MTTHINVLYIDDEQNNLNAFKAAFRKTFNLFLCSKVSDAYEILHKEDIHVVISDHKMPNESGLKFFENIAKSHPEIKRILLTAYGDYDLVKDAVNKGNIYRFLSKPWSIERLQETINDAGNIFLLHRNNENLRRSYLQLFYDSPNFLMILKKESGHILRLNRKMEELLKPILRPEENDRTIVSIFGQAIDIEKTKVLQLLVQDRMKRFQVACKELVMDNEPHVLVTLTDITELEEKQREREALIAAIQQEERNNLSMEIHDGLAQEIIALKLAVESLGDCEGFNDTLKKHVFEGVKNILNKTRSLSYNLTPPELEEGLLNALETLALRMQRVSNCTFKIDFDKKTSSRFTDLSFSQHVYYQFYRVFQEFINNSIQHGKPSQIHVSLKEERDSLILSIADNGKGFNIEKGNLGLGLKNIENRMQSIGVKYTLTSNVKHGTNLQIILSKN